MSRGAKTDVPTVNYTSFGEEYSITDYIQVGNPQLGKIAEGLKGENPQEKFEAVLEWMGEHLDYPLGADEKPTAHQICKAFKWYDERYIKVTPGRFQDYSWRFPNQTVTLRMGICFDSACVCTTLFRLLDFPAYTALGGILDSDTEDLLGLHAWTEVQRENEWYAVETTMQPRYVKCKVLYTGGMDVRYDPFAWFNEEEYIEDQKKVQLYDSLITELM